MGRAFGSLGATDTTERYRFILPTGNRHFTVGEWYGLRDHKPEQLRDEYARGTLPTIPAAKGDVRKDKELLALYSTDIYTAGFVFGDAATRVDAKRALGNDADFPEVVQTRVDAGIAYVLNELAAEGAESKKTTKAYEAARDRERDARQRQHEAVQARRLAQAQAARVREAQYFRLPDGRVIPMDLYGRLRNTPANALQKVYSEGRGDPKNPLGRFPYIMDDVLLLRLISTPAPVAAVLFGTPGMRNQAIMRAPELADEQIATLRSEEDAALLQSVLTQVPDESTAYVRRAEQIVEKRLARTRKLREQQRAVQRKQSAVKDTYLAELAHALQELDTAGQAAAEAVADQWPPEPENLEQQTFNDVLSMSISALNDRMAEIRASMRGNTTLTDDQKAELRKEIDTLIVRTNELRDVRSLFSMTTSREEYLTLIARATKSPNIIAEIDRHAAFREWKRQFDNPSRDFLPGSYDYSGLTGKSFNYLATLIGFKADPMGRFPLMDVFSNGRKTALMLSAAADSDGKQVLLAGVYHGGEIYEKGTERYIRQHGLPGARIQKQGWGAAAYMASAWMATVVHNLRGSASYQGSRTDTADEVWESLLKYGSAIRMSEKEKKITTERICLPLPGEQDRWRPRAFEWNNGIKGRIVSDEVCGSASVEYEQEGKAIDYLKSTELKNSRLLLWSIYDKLDGITFNMDWRWNGKSDDSVQRIRTLPEDAVSSVFHSRSIDRPAAERLARSYHGDSVILILTIARKLIDDGYDELAKQYLMRNDIAQIAGSNQKYLELLGQRRLPILLDGLSGIGEVEALHQAAGRGKLHVDWKSENPLNLPKLSAATKRQLEDFPDY